MPRGNMMSQKTFKETADKMVEDAFMKGCNLCVLVEDIDDNHFWRCLIETIKPDLENKLDFPNPCPKGTRGKDILKKFQEFISQKLIICLDSDCVYLYDDKVWYFNKKYIYHTIVYSKENFQCNPISLNKICKQLTDKSYNFEKLFQIVSLKISTLFYMWIYLMRNKQYQRFTKILNNEKFRFVLDIKNVPINLIDDESNIQESIEERAKSILIDLKSAMGDGWYEAVMEYDIPENQQQLIEQYRIYPEDTLQFFYGHAVLENFVDPLMEKIVKLLKDLRENELCQEINQASEKVRKETLQHFENVSHQSLQPKIRDSFVYIFHVLYRPIKTIQHKLADELGSTQQ